MLPHLSRVYTQGIRFAHTGIQTSFGRFISNRFTDEIQNKGHGYVEGEGIQVLEAGIDAKDIRQSGRGGIKLKDVDSVLAGNKKDEYLLSGSYWDMGRYVQIRLVLRNYKEKDALSIHGYTRHLYRLDWNSRPNSIIGGMGIIMDMVQ